MRTMVFALVLGLAPSLQAQSHLTRPGDTVWVVVHRVRPESQAQYDSLMQSVWAPASRRAGEKYPAYGRLAAERRRYVPTQLAGDSTYPYVYVYFGRPDIPPSPGGGNNVLRAAGLSRAQADSFAAAIRRFTASSSSAALVDQPYR